MLNLEVAETEYFNDEINEFVKIKPCELQLEHSLISVSKWESKWTKPYLKEDDKTREELLDYIRCMVITKNFDPNFVYALTSEQLTEISNYINTSQTATWFSDHENSEFNRRNGKGDSGVITSEVLYYLMVATQIPFECQKWHLSRLLTLIKVYQEKNKEHEKMSKQDILARNAKLNAARRKALNSKG